MMVGNTCRNIYSDGKNKEVSRVLVGSAAVDGAGAKTADLGERSPSENEHRSLTFENANKSGRQQNDVMCEIKKKWNHDVISQNRSALPVSWGRYYLREIIQTAIIHLATCGKLSPSGICVLCIEIHSWTHNTLLFAQNTILLGVV
jgi:hypothetical protein